MKVVNMRKYDGENSPTKAFFDFETDQGVVIKGFKLVKGSKGLFMSNPSEKSKKDGKWYDRVYIPRELKDELENAVINMYSGADKEGPGPF